MPAGIIITTTMIEGAALLRLLAWLSPAFPTGAYAYSHGLEWAVETKEVRDGLTLRAWLEDLLAHGAGRNDAIVMRHAHRTANDPPALAAVARLALALQVGHPAGQRARLRRQRHEQAALLAGHDVGGALEGLVARTGHHHLVVARRQVAHVEGAVAAGAQVVGLAGAKQPHVGVAHALLGLPVDHQALELAHRDRHHQRQGGAMDRAEERSRRTQPVQHARRSSRCRTGAGTAGDQRGRGCRAGGLHGVIL